MVPHSSHLAWKIPWMEESGRLQSMGSLRVGHDWATSLSLFTFVHWRRKWQPTPVFLPGESQGWGSMVGCRLWGHAVGHDWSDLAAAAAAAVLCVCIRTYTYIPIMCICMCIYTHTYICVFPYFGYYKCCNEHIVVCSAFYSFDK